MRPGFDEAPVNPLPPVVWLILLPIVAMEVVLSAGSLGLAGGQGGIGWRAEALQRFALSPLMLDQMWAAGQASPDYLMRFVSYAFVHGNLTHAIFAAVFVLALGKFVGEVFRGWAVAVVFLGAVVAGGWPIPSSPDSGSRSTAPIPAPMASSAPSPSSSGRGSGRPMRTGAGHSL